MKLTLAKLKSRYLSIHLRVQWEMSRQYVLLRGLFPYSGIARGIPWYTPMHTKAIEKCCVSLIYLKRPAINPNIEEVHKTSMSIHIMKTENLIYLFPRIP